MKLLIVGNGSIGIDRCSQYYINNHTGHFLKEVSEQHEVCFLEKGSVFNVDNNLQNFDLKEHGLNFKIAPRLKSLLSIPKLLLLLLKYDSVYLFYPGSLSKVVAILSIIMGKSFGLYIRGQYYKESIIDRFILKYAKYILTVSPSIMSDIKQFCSDVDIIKPMISIKTEDFKLDRIYAEKTKWRFLFVGRVEYRKGIFELLQIANILKQKDIDFVFDIVGGGDSFSDIETIIKKYGLSDYVQVHGLVSNKDTLKNLYDNADAFVFTSHDEGFPRVLYEAMASGLPIFTTFVGGISGRMIDGVNCFEIPVKNPEAAAKVIYSQISSIAGLEKVGQSGQTILREILSGGLVSHDQLLIRTLKNEK